MRALYRHFGYGFYCIDYPVVTGLEALQKAGMTAERDFLLYDFCQTAAPRVPSSIRAVSTASGPALPTPTPTTRTGHCSIT